MHFFDVGYFDDFEAQINTGVANPLMQGSRAPIMPDFKLTRMHTKTTSHGVGYYERFFSDTAGNFWDTLVALETRHILSAQKLYALDSIVSIKYDDHGTLVSVSDYIRNHPTTFSDYQSTDFMSKVRLEYSKGTVVFVNRNPLQTWTIKWGANGDGFNYHATINNRDSLFVGTQAPQATWTLPAQSGWLVVDPKISSRILNGSPKAKLNCKYNIRFGQNRFHPKSKSFGMPVVVETEGENKTKTEKIYDFSGKGL